MEYQILCALPIRSYPLNGLPLFSVPGGSAVIPSLEVARGGGGSGVSGRVQEDLYRWRIRDDEEIIYIIMAIVLSGRLG